MRACDERLTNKVLQAVLLCITAREDEARVNCVDMSAVLKHRAKEGAMA